MRVFEVLKLDSGRRLFVAVGIPESQRLSLSAKLSKAFEGLEGFSVTSQEKLHFTLCFLGSTASGEIPGITQNLSRIECRKFSARIEGCGSFDDRVLWLGVSEGKSGLSSLALKVCSALGLERRDFRPHLTIARRKRATDSAFTNALESLKAVKLGERFCVEGFELMESVKSGGGNFYKVLHSFALSGN